MEGKNMGYTIKLAFFVNDVAQLTGLSAQKIRRMIKAGELQSIRAGKRILVPRAALEQFISGDKAAQ
jgi:excisionase family DNA binding protein